MASNISLEIDITDNGTEATANYSHCKYFLEAGHTIQCYESDEHMLSEIHAYLALSPLEWVISIIYIFVFALGVSGNFLVAYAVWRTPHLRTITNIFLTNLSLADFLTILVCLPPSFAQTIWETWFLGAALCKVVTYLQTVAVIVSVLTLTTISVERWFAICHPLTFQQTKTRVIICVVLVWLIGLSASVPRLVMNEEIHDSLIPPDLTILLTSCAPKNPTLALNYEIFLVITFFALPCGIMGYNYTAIALCLWSSSNSSRTLTEGDQQAIISQLMARRRTAKMLVVVVMVFFICFLPNYIWNILRNSNVSLGAINEFVPAITLITQLMVYTNSCTNPVIYNFMSGKFRKEFRSACNCCIRLCSGRARRRKQKNMSMSKAHEMEPLSHKSVLLL